MNENELVELEAYSSTPVISLTNLLTKIYEESVSSLTKDSFLNQKATRFILSVLSKKGGLTQNDLVRITHMKGSTISVTLSKLEEEGMIERKSDSYDNRCIRVYLTDDGIKLNQRREEILDILEQKGKRGITPKEIKEAVFVLSTYLNNLLEK